MSDKIVSKRARIQGGRYDAVIGDDYFVFFFRQ